MALWTVIADYRGGTYISQWQAPNALAALQEWTKASTYFHFQFVGPKTKLKLIAAARDENENPTAIENTQNVWYWKPLKSSLVVHIIKTAGK